MSHFSDYVTKICDLNGLLFALDAMGYARENVEVHKDAVHLYDYQGDKRKDKANVVVRRQHVGHMSNDLGFLKEETGHYSAIISDYDRGKHNEQWLGKLNQAYAGHTTKEKLRAKGFKVFTQKIDEQGNVHLNMRKN